MHPDDRWDLHSTERGTLLLKPVSTSQKPTCYTIVLALLENAYLNSNLRANIYLIELFTNALRDMVKYANHTDTTSHNKEPCKADLLLECYFIFQFQCWEVVSGHCMVYTSTSIRSSSLDSTQKLCIGLSGTVVWPLRYALLCYIPYRYVLPRLKSCILFRITCRWEPVLKTKKKSFEKINYTVPQSVDCT